MKKSFIILVALLFNGCDETSEISGRMLNGYNQMSFKEALEGSAFCGQVSWNKECSGLFKAVCFGSKEHLRSKNDELLKKYERESEEYENKISEFSRIADNLLEIALKTLENPELKKDDLIKLSQESCGVKKDDMLIYGDAIIADCNNKKIEEYIANLIKVVDENEIKTKTKVVANLIEQIFDNMSVKPHNLERPFPPEPIKNISYEMDFALENDELKINTFRKMVNYRPVLGDVNFIRKFYEYRK